MADKELDAIQAILTQLEGLDPPARRRVLEYAARRFDAESPQRGLIPDDIPPDNPDSPSTTPLSKGSAEVDRRNWSDFAELYYSFEPSSNSEKILVATYWQQVIQGNDGCKSNQANALLKPLGEEIPNNVYREYDRLIKQKPRLVMPLASGGSGWKTYALTRPGIQLIEERIKDSEL